MNDPNGAARRFYASSSVACRAAALSNWQRLLRARKAADANSAGRVEDAFYHWPLVFDGRFPAR